MENLGANQTATEAPNEFIGNHPVRLDSALRLPIPAKFRETLELLYGTGNLQVAIIPDFGKVKVLPIPVWREWEKDLRAQSSMDPDIDLIRSYIFGNMSICTLDAQHRVRLTPELCSLIGLVKEVVFVGQQDRFEIWDAAKWKEFSVETAKNLPALMANAMRNRQQGGAFPVGPVAYPRNAS